MTDYFSREADGSPFAITVDGPDGEPVHPPTVLLFAVVAEVVATAFCFLPATKPLHVVGYLIGAVGVALTSVIYRSIDRKRRRSRMYGSQPVQRHLLLVMLIVAVGLAALHGYYLAQSKVIAG